VRILVQKENAVAIEEFLVYRSPCLGIRPGR
jgi:hypothetical protein